MNKSTIIYLGISILLSSCKGDDDNGASPVLNIDDELKSFVDSFYSEMKNRGFNFENRSLSVVFVDGLSAPNSSQFCAYGYPSFGVTGEARVEILNTETCWHRWGDIQKENLMYHELGHALLSKGHQNQIFPNGLPKSIMCSSTTCNNYRTYNKYQSVQKEYYLDQLADSQFPMPDWAAEKNFASTLYEDDFDSAIEGWESDIENNTSNIDFYSFFIENENVFSPPAAMGISASPNAESGAFGNWYKDFQIEITKPCSNIIVRSDIITENLSDGFAALVIDLYDENEEDFARYFNIIDGSTNGVVSYENFEATLICVPVETKTIRVRYYMTTQVEASIYFDNLEIELFE